MEERTGKIDIAESLPKTIEIGGESLFLKEIEKENKPESFEGCRVFCYDRISVNGLIDFYNFGNLGLLGVISGTEGARAERGVNLLVSYLSNEDPPRVIIGCEQENLCDGKRISSKTFGHVWFVGGEGLREHTFGRLQLRDIHGLVFIPIPDLENQAGTGGVLIIRPEYLLKSEKPELDMLLAERKFNS